MSNEIANRYLSPDYEECPNCDITIENSKVKEREEFDCPFCGTALEKLEGKFVLVFVNEPLYQEDEMAKAMRELAEKEQRELYEKANKKTN